MFLLNIGTHLPGPHGVTTWKTNIDIFITVRTSDLIYKGSFLFNSLLLTDAHIDPKTVLGCKY
jgi:hypothetical protein